MNATLLDQITEAVLYEGYVLYPYRPSSKKNQRQRFTFGRLYPESYSLAQHGAEPCVMQTQCLLRVHCPAPTLRVTVRFLQPIARDIGRFRTPLSHYANETLPAVDAVPELQADGRLFQAWHEAVERYVTVPVLSIGGKAPMAIHKDFTFWAYRELEPITAGQMTVGRVERRRETIEGRVEVEVHPLEPRLHQVTVRVTNRTKLPAGEADNEDALLLRMFASTHTVLRIQGAEWLSLLDPPAEAKEAAGRCRNIGTWPVLVGDEARQEQDTILSSPIILYHYPRIAAESAGPLFDSTEIDELLSLRIQTMTDQEKAEMRQVEPQVRRLLERTEAMPPAALLRMHGARRGPTAPAAVEFDDFFGAATRLPGVTVQGMFLQAGDRVRIRPKARADVMDLALNGETAVVEAIEQDLEKRVHLALVLDKDPGKDLGLMRQPGHRFFFGIDEVEPLRRESV